MRAFLIRSVSMTVLLFPALAHTQMLDTSQDTWLNGNNPSKVHGSAKAVQVSGKGPKVGLIQFDISSISSTDVQSAVLDLFVDSVATGGSVRLHMVRGAWSEDSASFRFAPLFDATPFHTFPIPKAAAGGVVGIEIDAAVQEWASDPSSNFGIALTSTDAFVTFGSAEGGMPATVNLSLGQSVPNIALVAKKGGDYKNPLDAIEDLESWCEHACTLLIGPGRFELTSSLTVPEDRALTVRGFGRNVTTLVSAGIRTTIEGSGAFSDFGVVNEGGNGSSAVGMDVLRSSIENVSVTVSQAHTAVGIVSNAPGSAPKGLSNVEVHVSETMSAFGIQGEGLEADQIDILITSSGPAFGYREGLIDDFGQEQPRGSLTNFNIRVQAEGGATGLGAVCEGCVLDAAHGTVRVSGGGGRTVGIAIADARRFIGRNLRVAVGSANSPAVGVGVSTFDLAADVRLENSYIFAESAIEGVGLSIEDLAGLGYSVFVKHSELSGEGVGVLFTTPGFRSPLVAIDNSIVSGRTNSIVGQQGWRIGIGSSKLVGSTLPQGSEMTCALVYDEDYNAFVDSCP